MVRGYIVPIGGAEEKTQNPKILERFVAVCGGSDAVIAVIPTASRLEETGPSYVRFFESLGVKKARTFPIEERSDGEREDWIEALDRATGVFLTGGNQLRLTTYLGGTTLATALRRRNADGLHIAGTSAGAAYLAGHMIAYGRGGATPRAEKVTLSPGLGLLNSAVIDQHFRQRDRIGRLLTALAFNPFAVGMGLDEDTAAFIGPD